MHKRHPAALHADGQVDLLQGGAVSCEGRWQAALLPPRDGGNTCLAAVPLAWTLQCCTLERFNGKVEDETSLERLQRFAGSKLASQRVLAADLLVEVLSEGAAAAERLDVLQLLQQIARLGPQQQQQQQRQQQQQHCHAQQDGKCSAAASTKKSFSFVPYALGKSIARMVLGGGPQEGRLQGGPPGGFLDDRAAREALCARGGDIAACVIQANPDRGYTQVCEELLPFFEGLLHAAEDSQTRKAAADAVLLIGTHMRPSERLTFLLPVGIRLCQCMESSRLRCLSCPFLHLLSELFSCELRPHLLLPQLLFLAHEDADAEVRALAIRHLAAMSPGLEVEAVEHRVLPVVLNAKVEASELGERIAATACIFDLAREEKKEKKRANASAARANLRTLSLLVQTDDYAMGKGLCASAQSLPGGICLMTLLPALRSSLEDNHPCVRLAAKQQLCFFLTAVAQFLDPSAALVAIRQQQQQQGRQHKGCHYHHFEAKAIQRPRTDNNSDSTITRRTEWRRQAADGGLPPCDIGLALVAAPCKDDCIFLKMPRTLQFRQEVCGEAVSSMSEADMRVDCCCCACCLAMQRLVSSHALLEAFPSRWSTGAASTAAAAASSLEAGKSMLLPISAAACCAFTFAAAATAAGGALWPFLRGCMHKLVTHPCMLVGPFTHAAG
ncbi:uncharacterized protein LOC34623709 [Cyclospora cayetanensis]|uniref:Uncharacterized protein LOC34623709 n=1 Tax=Cyclospora cayetanensis TaxID=88456 RepID=A0A6P6RYH6_9EIME|nr:uncharacterized protein LOC34623709 [Cyclospora cayetanensis]